MPADTAGTLTAGEDSAGTQDSGTLLTMAARFYHDPAEICELAGATAKLLAAGGPEGPVTVRKKEAFLLMSSLVRQRIHSASVKS